MTTVFSRNIKLTIEYDGANFFGWQKQENKKTVQGELEKAIVSMVNHPIKLRAASRTDAGVHALGQVANFYTHKNISLTGFARGITNRAGGEISITDCEEVHADFDSKINCGKMYIYQIWNASQPSAIHRNFSWHVFTPFDIERVNDTLPLLFGENDLEAFRDSTCEAEHAIRTIYTIKAVKTDNLVKIYFLGNAFGRYMVRILAGTIAEIGRKRIDSNGLLEIMNARDRRKAGQTAPPQGLFLAKVFYSFQELGKWVKKIENF